MKGPTKFQSKAIQLALPSGYLRRLPGGYWVGNETPWRGNQGMLDVPEEQWVGTQTVMACRSRGWMEVSDYLARLTDTARALSPHQRP